MTQLSMEHAVWLHSAKFLDENAESFNDNWNLTF